MTGRYQIVQVDLRWHDAAKAAVEMRGGYRTHEAATAEALDMSQEPLPAGVLRRSLLVVEVDGDRQELVGPELDRSREAEEVEAMEDHAASNPRPVGPFVVRRYKAGAEIMAGEAVYLGANQEVTT